LDALWTSLVAQILLGAKWKGLVVELDRVIETGSGVAAH
jgi:hypothetical protein